MQDSGERLGYTTPEGAEVSVPVFRHNCPEAYIALKQPEATPYVVAPPNMPGQAIVEFFTPHVKEVDDLRAKMRKRLEHGVSDKCTFQTGDVVYVMGRPFMIDVYPLENRDKLAKGSRGRATLKCSVNTVLSVIRLYVVQRSYDQARGAFLSYARDVIAKNAQLMTQQACAQLMPGRKVPTVRMREMRGRFARMDSGALWVSEDIIGYPPDCLMVAIFDALATYAHTDEQQAAEILQRFVPGWKAARHMLESHAKPYSMQ